MFIHRSLGVASLVELMAAHREEAALHAANRAGSARQDADPEPPSGAQPALADFTTRPGRPMADPRRMVRRRTGELQA
jgi:hypothetical protein